MGASLEGHASISIFSRPISIARHCLPGVNSRIIAYVAIELQRLEAQPNQERENKMTAEMNSTIKPKTGSERIGTLVGGGLLALFGFLVLVNQFVDLGRTLVFYPGLAMLALGVVTRRSGWFIPAGILNGCSLAVVLQGAIIAPHWTDESGLSVIGFALGWMSIPLFSALFTKEKHLWALIPGGLFALAGIGFILAADPLKFLDVLAYATPAALILAGVGIIFAKKQK
jgi:hypothetical protein